MPLEREAETYRREVERLLAEGHANRHVLIKGDDIISIWDTQRDALQAACEKYGLEPFAVVKIDARDPERLRRIDAPESEQLVPSLILPIVAEGARVEIEVGWARARARAARLAGQPIPPPVQVRALIDTGAETSCLDSAYVQQLGLPLGGMILANVPALGGTTFASEHDASLTVLHPSGQQSLNLVLSDVLVLDLDLGALGYQALLGRDVLAWCRLLYDGQGSRFKLRY